MAKKYVKESLILSGVGAVLVTISHIMLYTFIVTERDPVSETLYKWATNPLYYPIYLLCTWAMVLTWAYALHFMRWGAQSEKRAGR